MEMRKIEQIQELVGGIYWYRIENKNPLYLETIQILEELCKKENISYQQDTNFLLKNFLEEKQFCFLNSIEINQQLQIDLKNISTLSDVYRMKNKYFEFLQLYRKEISTYIMNNYNLIQLLNGEIERLSDKINNFPSLEERLKPLKRIVTDENGFWVLDATGELEDRLETQEEIQERNKTEEIEYENSKKELEKLKQELAKWTEFCLILPKLSEIYLTIKEADDIIGNLENKYTLEEYSANLEFMDELHKIMTHDSENEEYLYHGTQCLEDAESILEQGLYMEKRDLSYTTYSEFTAEELLLYHRGFDGMIGRDAIVIIRKPKGEDIVVENTSSTLNINQSGLSSFGNKMGYMVPDKYIVGYIDKRNQRIIYNPKLLEDKYAK